MRLKMHKNRGMEGCWYVCGTKDIPGPHLMTRNSHEAMRANDLDTYIRSQIQNTDVIVSSIDFVLVFMLKSYCQSYF